MVFEELRTIHANWVAQKLGSIRFQYNYQIKALDDAGSLDVLPSELLTQAAITEHLIETVEAQVEAYGKSAESEFRIGPRLPAYGMFDASRAYARYLGALLETKKFSNFLDSLVLELPSASDFETAIRENVSRHREPTRSMEIFLGSQLERFIPTVIKAYLKRNTGSEDRQLVNYFVSQSGEDSMARGVISAKLRRGLSEPVNQGREAVVISQLNQYFPFVRENAPLPEVVIERIFFDERGIAEEYTFDEIIAMLAEDRIAARSLPLGVPLLLETEESLKQFFNTSASNGLQALTAQFRVLKEIEEANIDDLKASVEAGVPFETLLEEWTVMFNNRWERTPVYSLTPYKRMFNLTEVNLEKTIRQFYSSPDEVIPPTPPGEVPSVFFSWQKDEVQDVARRRQEWFEKYGERYTRGTRDRDAQ